jgi:hypothetical protein
MTRILRSAVLAAALFSCCSAFAQDDLEKLLDSISPPTDTRVSATFKAIKLINAQTTETAKKGTMDFRITHRFGNTGAESGGGVHNLWGWDNSEDIRFSFDFGITNNLQIGVARNKRQENLDGSIKWRFMNQTTDNKRPLSIALFSIASVTPMREEDFYAGVDPSVSHMFAHRMVYTTQLLLARKWNWRLSTELIGSYNHRNFVRGFTYDGNAESNDIVSAGAALRFKLTKRFGIVLDYFHNFSAYRNGNPSYHDPLGIGCEIETGGHVFTLNFTNASAIIENDFIPNTTDDWMKGGFKFGFNISRVFTIVKPKM